MRDIYVLLDLLDKLQINFCFQTIFNNSPHYSLMVDGPDGKEYNFHSASLDEAETKLVHLWGESIEIPKLVEPDGSVEGFIYDPAMQAVDVPCVPMPTSMPVPNGMPLP